MGQVGGFGGQANRLVSRRGLMFLLGIGRFRSTSRILRSCTCAESGKLRVGKERDATLDLAVPAERIGLDELLGVPAGGWNPQKRG